MSDDIYAAWENLGDEVHRDLLRRLPEEVDDEEDDTKVRMWLAQQTGLKPEQIPDDNVR